jgi:hypothetical protein
MSAFEADRFNHSRTSPRGENPWSSNYFIRSGSSGALVHRFDADTPDPFGLAPVLGPDASVARVFLHRAIYFGGAQKSDASRLELISS